MNVQQAMYNPAFTESGTLNIAVLNYLEKICTVKSLI